ncbi:MAG: stage III sporulation protein AC [Clostridia bacterium]|nr:stage III sporulation protein AC [Clostridia bacterium]
MDIDLIFRIAGIGVVIAVISQLLSKAGREDIALLLAIAGLVGVMCMITMEIGEFFELIKQIFEL